MFKPEFIMPPGAKLHSAEKPTFSGGGSHWRPPSVDILGKR